MRIPRIDCIFHTETGQCAHLERGRGFLWLGKQCVLHDGFSSECCKRIPHYIPKTQPPKAE